MSIQVLQKPSDIQPAQSPIVFSVFESGSNAYTASEFQYTANLYIWNGAPNQSGSYLYQARKFPNVSGSGIFDFGRFINSTLTDLSSTNGSNIKYYSAEFGWQYYNGTTYVSQSGGFTPVTCSVGGTLFKAYDGYALFPDPINDALVSQSAYYPFMTDAGIVTQSVQLTDKSTIGAYSKGLSIWIGATDSTLPTSIVCTASYSNGTQGTLGVALPNVGNVSSSQQIYHLPSSPGDQDWNTYWPTPFNLVSYVFNAYSGSTVIGTLAYKIENECYYTPVRIAYKNRFGQFDFINFYKRHNNTFNTDQRLYQPQLGSWEAATLSYDQYQTRQQRYIVDATEVVECNTGFLEEGYNELLKQLLVSDEIYWLFDQENNIIKPLTIQTNSIQFKTGVNNKLIQYTIVFDIGQPYKLIL